METKRAGISHIIARYGKVQNLMCYVNAETLKTKHREMPKGKASGVDEVTWEEYDRNLNVNIAALIAKMKQFSYRPQPAKRVYIPKGNGKLRPLGMPCYEDKLVAAVMADTLNEVYECLFLDTSYGFKPNRGCHDAVRELNRLKGTAQGSPISPILANVYLHYVLDLWFAYLKNHGMFRGEAYIVRYADDFVMLFQYKSDAEEMYKALPERMAKFGLELAMDKTKIMAFGRLAKQNSKGGRTETLDFLGFTLCNGTTRNGKYRVHIQTNKKKLKAKRQAVKAWLKEHMHSPVGETLKSLNRKLQGHVNYYGINGNSKMLANFFTYIKESFIRVLRARGQKHPIKWDDFQRMWEYYIKPPKIVVNIWS